MSILFYTDAHHGDDLIYDESSPSILGSWAIPINRAIQRYAEVNNIRMMIDGGDQTTYSTDKAAHLRRAREFATCLNQFNGLIVRIVGNHDPFSHIHTLNFTPYTDGQAVIGMDHTSLLNYQFYRKTTQDRPTYFYNPYEALHTISSSLSHPRKHSLLASHWSLDRMQRGYPEYDDRKAGYIYEDSSHRVLSVLKNAPLPVLGLHGHEHGFALNSYGQYTSLVMPSIVQEDADIPPLPCGLFLELSESEEGLKKRFMKVVVPANRTPETFDPDTAKVIEVDFAYMNKYQKPKMAA